MEEIIGYDPPGKAVLTIPGLLRGLRQHKGKLCVSTKSGFYYDYVEIKYGSNTNPLVDPIDFVLAYIDNRGVKVDSVKATENVWKVKLRVNKRRTLTKDECEDRNMGDCL